VTEALTTEQIDALKAENPLWLQHERANQVDVRKETARIKAKHEKEAAEAAAKAAKAAKA
ncbi:DUF5997 family protein, partial [Kitasatospora sp. NPDC059747]